MSPLWSDLALARAAWAKACERGLVDRDAVEQPIPRSDPNQPSRDAPRRPIRRTLSSIAL
jgi:hypothetical protein